MKKIAFVKSSESHLAQYKRLRLIYGDQSVVLFDLNQWGRMNNPQDERSIHNFCRRYIMKLRGALVTSTCTSAILFYLIFLNRFAFILKLFISEKKQDDFFKLRNMFNMISPETTPSGVKVSKKRIKGTILQRIISNSLFFRSLAGSIVRFYELGHKLNPAEFSHVILPEENVVSFNPFLVLLIESKGIKVLVLQYTVGVEDEWTNAFSAIPETKIQSVDRALSLWLFPEYVKRSDSSSLAVLPVAVSTLASNLNIEPANLWSGYVGFCSNILIDSEKEMDYLSSFPEIYKKAKLICPLEVEIIIKSQAIYEQRRRRENFVTIFLPPNQGLKLIAASNLGSTTTYLGFIKELIESVRSSIPLDTSLNFIIHPRNLELFRYISSDFVRKIYISTDMYEDLYNCQLAIIFGSAMYRITTLLKIPTLNWNIYNYDYPNTFPANSPTFLTVNLLVEADIWLDSALLRKRIPVTDIDLSVYPLMSEIISDI